MVGIQLDTIPLPIPARQTRPLDISGAYLKILKSTSEDDVSISFDNGPAALVPVGYGMPCLKWSEEEQTYLPDEFDSVQIRNPTDSDMVVTLVISNGAIDSPMSIEGSINTDPSGAAFDTPPGVVVDHLAPVVVAANALIKERIIQNNSYVNIWIGDEGLDPVTGRGLRVEAGGGVVVVPIRGAFYAIAEEDPQGTDCFLSVLNILKG